MKKITEVELAQHIVAWLQDAKWEVYQEVNTGMHYPVCDIVAVQGSILWAIECKTSLGLAVLDQAMYWRIHESAHYISVATPGARRGSQYFLSAALQSTGIGALAVDDCGNVIETHHPRLSRNVHDGLLCLSRHLHESQKTFCDAGSKSGYWSPFKETCGEVLEAVKAKPGGITVKELMDNIRHHYHSTASARSCIVRYINLDIIPGIRAEKEKGRWVLYPLDQKIGENLK